MSKDTTNPIRWFDFTIWQSPIKYPDIKVTSELLKALLDTFCEKYAFQLEECPTTKSLHFQGRCYLGLDPKTKKDRRLRLAQIAKKLPQEVVGPLICGRNLTPTSKLGWNFQYVCKEDTRVEGPFIKNVEDYEIDPGIDPDLRLIRIDKDNYHPWQRSFHDLVKRPPKGHEETVNVLLDKGGGIGKTVIAQRMAIKHKDYVHRLIYTGQADRLVEHAFSFIMDCSPKQRIEVTRTFIIDVPCAGDYKKMAEFYSAVEQIKAGYICDRRYSMKTIDFKTPQIWIFANKEPEYEHLTARRWVIWNVDKDMKLVPFQRKLTMCVNQPRLTGDLVKSIDVTILNKNNSNEDK